MRIHLISRQTVLNFISQHSGSRASFKEWLKKIKKQIWHRQEISNIPSSLPMYWEEVVTGSSLMSVEIITGSFASTNLERIRFVFLFAGLEHMGIMTSCARIICSIVFVYIDLKIDDYVKIQSHYH